MQNTILLLLLSLSHAQNEMIDPSRPGLRQEGQLFIIQIVAAEPLRSFDAS